MGEAILLEQRLSAADRLVGPEVARSSSFSPHMTEAAHLTALLISYLRSAKNKINNKTIKLHAKISNNKTTEETKPVIQSKVSEGVFPVAIYNHVHIR